MFDNASWDEISSGAKEVITRRAGKSSACRNIHTCGQFECQKVALDWHYALHRMLNKDPRKRATIPELLAHPWMMTGQRRRSEGSGPKPVSNVVVSRLRAFANMNRFKKEARRLIATFLPEEEVHGLRRIFEEMDTDFDGLLSLSELHHALTVKGNSVLKSQAKVWLMFSC